MIKRTTNRHAGHTIRLLTAIPASLLLICAAASCANGKKEDRRDAQREYVAESVKISRLYLDSIRHAGDSASISRLMAGFDDALTKLNYKYPADLYLTTTESENDTMSAIVLAVAAARDSILYRLAHPVSPVDSTVASSDSIPHPDIE